MQAVQPGEIHSNVAAIFEAGISSPLSLPLIEVRVPAGFPSPADDYHTIKIDLDKDLISHPTATFFVRVCDDLMIEENIYDRDVLLVDRAETRSAGISLSSKWRESFMCVAFTKTSAAPDSVRPIPKYQDNLIADATDCEIWGKVIYSNRPH
jgi:DNA polymerase V